jgi:hypothetical protein
VPYASGETPVLGDYVKNDLEQSGTVIRLRMASSGDDFVSIRARGVVQCLFVFYSYSIKLQTKKA